MLTIVLLAIANVFMTFAWYGHLKFKNVPIPLIILVSWLIALVEYCFQVPANRIGIKTFSPTQLKIMQEIISLTIFVIFSVLYLKESMRWNYIISFLLICGAVFFAFKKF